MNTNGERARPRKVGCAVVRDRAMESVVLQSSLNGANECEYLPPNVASPATELGVLNRP